MAYVLHIYLTVSLNYVKAMQAKVINGIYLNNYNAVHAIHLKFNDVSS